MEKLIVRNFGPIKEAEIDLTKYVVFIGDTSTGKSVLGKLISIFREFANISNNKITDFDFIKEFNFKNELKNYNIDFSHTETFIEYFDKDFHIKLESEALKIIYDNRQKYNLHDEISKSALLDNYDFSKIGIKGKNVYFPPERILTSMIGGAISGLWANNVAISNSFKIFAAKYEVARREINNSHYNSFGFSYKYENGEEIITNTTEDRFNLKVASSGIQSLIPMLLVIDYELKMEHLKPNLDFLVEEPELSLFPTKQKKLVEHIISKFFNKAHKLIITTHSPYILTIFDTLMLAKNTFNEHPDLKEEINAIVPESNWIDYNEISVYEVRNDGKVYSIKNEEFKSIDTNAIDGVSDVISEEFDKLTALRYAH